MVTCPACGKADSSTGFLHVYNISCTICDLCGNIVFQESGYILQMSRYNFGNGLMCVSWAMGEINKMLEIQTGKVIIKNVSEI